MAPNVTAHFFAANQPNGDVIHEITDEDSFFRGLKLNLERDGLGSVDMLLSRSINFAGFGSGTFQPEVFVRFLVHAYSDTVYYPWGLSLSKRLQTVVHKDEQGAEVFRFGGPGPKSLLQRHALRPVADLPGEWNLDLANGVWRWTENATIGQILNRVLNEDQARPNPSLGFLTTTFTASKDSAAVDWADADIVSGDGGLYEIPIGTDYLTILRDFGDLVELSSWIDLGEVDAPKFELNVIQGTRNDYTGSAVGAGVCLLKEGLNIANDSLEVEGQSLKKASHVIVEGKDGHWVIAQRPGFTPGDYVKIDKIEYSRSASDYWLDKAGIRWLKRQDLGEKEYTIEIVPGANDAAGLYFPAPDRVLWLDNLISVDTSADGTTHSQLDIAPSEDQLVTGLELELGKAGDTSSATAKARSWNVKAILNRERSGIQPKAPGQGSGSSGGGPGGGGGLKLCKPATEGTEPTDEATTLLKFYDANDGGDSIGWTGILANQGGSPGDGAEGSSYYYFKSTAPEQWQNIVAATAGLHYRFTGYFSGDSSTETLKVGFFSTGVGSPGNSAVLTAPYTVLAQGVHAKWYHFSVDVVAPAGTVGWALGRQGGGPAFDRIRAYSVDTEASPGTEGDPGDCPEDVALECDPGTGDNAARCDHVHAHGNLSDDGMHHHNSDDIEGGGGSGAPTTADYLVGTAQAGLSAEIVVGTTPGGELGGTWASPTVDATHSGSAHHTEDHDHDGSPTQKLLQANTHQTPDTDSGTSSLHHTLGTGANQAAAGNHSHGGGAPGGVFANRVMAASHIIFTAGTGSNATPTLGGAWYMPVTIPGPMRIRDCLFNMNTAASGTYQWGLFDVSASVTAATKLCGGSGSLNGTGWRSCPVSGAPVDVNAGTYIFIMLVPTSNGGNMYRASNTGSGLSKFQASYTWDDTPDFTTGWGTTTQDGWSWYLKGDIDTSNQW